MSVKHDQLMQEWEQLPGHKDQCFIRDGIIDETKWQTANRKVAFLLREAYDQRKRPEGFDLCHIIREKWKGPYSKTSANTWWTVANWAYAALYGTDDHIPELTEKVKPLRCESLLSTAVINVKKSNGVSTSDRQDIASYALKDGKFLRRQIEIIDPDIVICGNTWKAVSHIWECEDNRIYDQAYRVGRRVFINFWHPANRFPKRLNYYALACILQNCGALSG